MKFFEFSEVPGEPREIYESHVISEPDVVTYEPDVVSFAPQVPDDALDVPNELEQQEEEDRKLEEENLKEVKDRHEPELRRQAEASQALIDNVRSRLGDHRQQSLEELNHQIELLDSLKQAAAREAGEAAGGLLAEETDRWLRGVDHELEVSLRGLRQARDAVEDEERAQQTHNERAGLDAVIGRTLVAKIGRTVIKVLANHVVPGFGPALVDLGEAALRLVGVVGDPESIEGINFSLPVPVLGNLFALNIGTDLLDSHSEHEDRPLTLSADLDIGFNWPGIAVVEEGPDRSDGHQGEDQPEEIPIMESDPACQRHPRAKETSGPDDEAGTPQFREIVTGLEDPEPRQDLDQPPQDEGQADDRGRSSAETAEPSTIEIRAYGQEATRSADADVAITPEASPVLAEINEAQPPADQATETTTRIAELQAGVKRPDGQQPGQLATHPESGNGASDEEGSGELSRTTTRHARPGYPAGADDGAALSRAGLVADSGDGPTSRPATGVVICCSASKLAAAASTPYLDSRLILSLARQAVVRKLFDGTPGSLRRAASAAKRLEVVVFVDPELLVVLWIDVNPASQLPAATLVVTVDGPDGQPRVRSVPAAAPRKQL